MTHSKAARSAWARMRLRERIALRLYGGLMRLLPSAPVVAILRYRAARHAQREAAARVPERLAMGLPSRPEGPLIWLNAIGPGDATALLPLIRAFLAQDAANICVVTTRTASAQKVFARLEEPARVIAQLAPLDSPAAMRRFLNHWHPTLAIFGEGDMWPNAVQMLKARGTAIALVNGQMNGRLGKAFRKLPGVARWMAAHVDYLQVFTTAEAAEARPWFRPDCQIVVQPNLKMDAPPLPVSQAITSAVRAQWGTAPILTCASVANREVGTLLEAARLLRQDLPDLRLILVPRWIEQGPVMTETVRASGAGFSCRSADELPRADDQVFVADSYGEMGNWIDLSFAVFMGHTLNGGVGHNPFEPIAQKRMILSGSIPRFLQADYQYLADLGLCHVAADAPAITRIALQLWQSQDHGDDPFAPFETARGFAGKMASELRSLIPEAEPGT